MENTYSWYTPKTTVHSSDSIHQILRYGTLDDIRKLHKNIGHDTIKQFFLTHPKNIYSPASFNFIVKFILSIDKPVNKDAYLTSTPRYIG